jgi:adenine-specific DNA methylase
MMVEQFSKNISALDNHYPKLNPADWSGSCLAEESSLHQLSPYIGKIKSIFARKLITTYSKPEDVVLDPFAGSGTVTLESLIAGRHVIANDINPYALTLIKAKLFPPDSLEDAINNAKYYISLSKKDCDEINLEDVPDWVRKFYHPDTLKEIISLSQLLKKNNEYFFIACLMGILHHQRPGFLSYPASHLVPYLRTKKYPSEKYPEMYLYRDVESRFIKKIHRVYKRISMFDNTLRRVCFQKNAEELVLKDNSIDAIISSPPYMNALDYARDNRLRLWFLGEINTALDVIDIANSMVSFVCEEFIQDEVPTFRRARKEGACTKNEWIIVLRKVGN